MSQLDKLGYPGIILFGLLFLLISVLLAVTYTTLYVPGDRVVLQTTQGCGACEEAKDILNSHHIKFTEDRSRTTGLFPKLYVNGVIYCKGGGFLCAGTKPVINYVNEK